MSLDTGSQFSSQTVTNVLEEADVRISMRGKGRYIDHVFIERFGRSLRYENVDLHALENAREA